MMPASTSQPADMDTLDFQDYTSAFTIDNLDLFESYEFNFDVSELEVPELDFGSFSAVFPESVTNQKTYSEAPQYFQWGFNESIGCMPYSPRSCEIANLDPSNVQSHLPSYKPDVNLDGTLFPLAQQPQDFHTTNKKKESASKKWDSSMIVFSANPSVQPVQRKRKAFDSSRKKEVALNRAIGACILCKLKKSSVSFAILPKSENADNKVQFWYSWQELHQKSR